MFGKEDDHKKGRSPLFEMVKLVFPAFISTAKKISNY